jgi:16S rRNA processing protein RimM
MTIEASPLGGGASPAPVRLGRIVGLFGVRGWVKVHSDARPREAILGYNPWLLELDGRWREYRLAEGRVHGPGIVARFEGCTDRNAAQMLVGASVAVRREQLPPAEPGEYYWSDLEGLRVVNLQGENLGVVDHLVETGANDVMVVAGERERLIPFTRNAVREVDLKAQIIRVDWDRDF